MEYKERTEKIIGCAYGVYNQRGYGFLESIYEKCLIKEVVGEFVADLVVNDTVIVELKSVQKINRVHEVQLVNYLVATGKPVGLLINFGEERVEIRRVGKGPENQI